MPGLKRLTQLVLGLAALFFSLPDSFGQEKTIPDGTQGENFQFDSATLKPTRKRWNLFPGKITSFKLGGGLLYEFAGFSQDQASRQQMDSLGTSLESKFKVRDFRLVASGQFKIRRSVTWRVGFMYDGATDTWLMRESGLMIGVPELSGYFFIGRTKEGISMNKVMNGYAGWGLERQMALDVLPILADGIKWLGFLPRQRLIFNIGAFADWFSEGQSFSTYDWQGIVRAAWLPVYDKELNKVLHVGTSFRYGKTNDGKIQVRSRPEANPAPYFVDTGKFPTDRSNNYGVEAYYTSGPWMFGGEYYWHQFNSPSMGNPVFSGGEMVISRMLNGDQRPYDPSRGIYGFVPIAKPVFKGGWGAWETLFRVTNLDLDDGLISGGKIWRITPMVNWYMTDNLRLELAYGYSVMDRFGLSGATQIFQTRIQFIVL